MRLIIAVAFAALLAASAPARAATPWYWLFSPGTHAPAAQPDGLGFGFPVYNGPLPCKSDQSCASAHYLVTNRTAPLPSGWVMVAKGYITTAGNPIFEWRTAPDNHGTNPAAFRFLIQHQGDNLRTDFGRWWSTQGVPLQPGAFKLKVAILPQNFSSVFGHNGNLGPGTRAGFAAALAHPGRIGVTFGGGSFYGHGVNVRGGTAHMTITSFEVKPATPAAAKAKAAKVR